MHNVQMLFLFLLIAATPCKPNPCNNDGRCQQISYTAYTCDCTGTMYTGLYCEVGSIWIAALPQLVINKESSPIQVLARPTGYLTITPRSGSRSVVFTPSVIRIETPNTIATFTVTSSKVGSFEIRYKVD